MNSNRLHYVPLERSHSVSWFPAVVAACCLGVVGGLVLSSGPATESNLYTAAAVRTASVTPVQSLRNAGSNRVLMGATAEESSAPQSLEATSDGPRTLGWSGLAAVPLAALAGFAIGYWRPITQRPAQDPMEIIIDAQSEDIAMAATTGLLGHKVGMTRIPDANGSLTPVTVIRLGPCVVTQVKTTATDGYEAIQVGFHEVKEKRLPKPELGHLAKTGAPPLKHLKEYHVEDASKYTPGQVLMADVFAEGDLVDVQGEIIGKGFQGPVARWGFGRGLMTHGSKNHREPGSTGRRKPGRTYPFTKGPGHVGGNKTTMKKLTVMGIDTEQHLLLVKGSIPGAPGNLVSVQPIKKWTSLYAVVAIGGHQHIVQPGQILSIEKLPLEVGDQFTFDKVLLLKNGDEVEFGTPYLPNARVTAEVLRNSKGRKIRIFKYRSKKHTRITRGHRQKYTDVFITEVAGTKVPSRVAAMEAAKAEAAALNA